MPIDYTRSTSEKLSLIEGELHDLTSEPAAVDMNEVAMKGFTSFAAFAAAANGQVPTSIANTIVTAQNFSCRIGDKPVTGILTGTRLLQEGDTVRAVVSERDIGTYVHAIQRPKDGLLWLPVLEHYGTAVMAWFYAKFMAFMCFGTFLVIFITTYFVNLSQTGHGLKAISTDISIFAPLVGCSLLFLFMYWMYRPPCVRAEKIFKTFGFPDASHLNFASANFLSFHRDLARKELKEEFPDYRFVFYYQPAIDAHLAKTKVKYTQLPLPKGTEDPMDALNAQLEEDKRKGEESLAELQEMLRESQQLEREKAAKQKTTPEGES